ncbi:hepatocyte growth factor-like [Salvelinus fontinalis]|uniref:hepatocyte growth factor-like n=1 Tax=Salvelinus fontinalis TaxID=8038 RepID=UPI002485195C|nr:hepatocyte growth factor-like [Salvelinus fontinalis]
MKADIIWIYKLFLCVVLAVNSECRKQSLQQYQKSEDTRLLCPDCPQPSMVKNSRSLEHCARKCSKNKKTFTCRAFYFDHQNRKCHLLPFDRFMDGAHREHRVNFDLYEKKDYVRECIIGSGVNYKGRRAVTKDKIPCQSWTESFPHEHTFQPARLGKKDLNGNFCRNPKNESSGPWCFTTDPEVRHQECGLPQCSQVECMRCNGEDYKGPMDHTDSGKECQRWDSSKPHRHPYQPKKYPDKGLNDNYCRNPDNRLRPWCYTLDPQTPWEYCNISVCDPGNDSDVDATSSCFREQGQSYHGTVSVTPSGVTCQRWDSQFPHNHTYSPQNYKCKDLRENYCRNPDGAEIPWCFTTDPNQRLAFCTNIPRCETENIDTEDCYEDNGGNYTGNLSKTRSGIPCGLWENHSNSGESSVGLERNLCRNPDQDKHGPWCHTTDPSIPWDYCKLKRCDKSPNISAHPRSISLVSKTSCFIHKTTRIVGGAQVHKAKDGSWVVSIQKGNTHWCGGSLIREEWVLTDQQCFSSCVPDLSEYSVQVGLLHLNSSLDHPRLRIAHVVCGPEGSNLALLKLAKPAPLSEHAFTIQLPVAGCGVTDGTNCLMYGWGETKGTGYEGALKAVSLPMVSNDWCSELHDKTLPVTDSKVCAGGKTDQGVCERDYGGPLVCQERESKVIVGVSIHGRGCALARRPAIFVNVAYYSGWIHKVFIHYSRLEEKLLEEAQTKPLHSGLYH